ncbi:MAG: DNA-binding response regulator [Sulfurovum sp.]|nr:MAG: DNA-binding response regulator [Sulfurovum sp.]
MKKDCELILKSSTLLLAEDDKFVRESFGRVLSLYVGNILLAKDGEEALELFEKEQPDIIITDVKMPKLNGIELIKKIREENRSIPIIITSAYSDREYLLDAIKLSLVEYIIKPMKESQLNSVLENSAKILLDNSKTKIYFDENNYYDYTNKQFISNSNFISLTNKEIEFFELLLAHRGELVTKVKIEDKLYIYEEAPPSALKNLVFKLRKKLPLDIVKTYGKLGYIIE